MASHIACDAMSLKSIKGGGRMHASTGKGLFSRWQILVAVAPGLTLFAIFLIYPSLANIFYSFTNYKPFSMYPTKWVWFQNYIDLFAQSRNLELLLLALKNTVIISLLVSVIQNIMAALFAVLLNNSIKLRNFYRAVIFLPVTLGAVIQGLVWTLAFDPYNGTYARILSALGIHSTYFGDSNIALYLVIMIIMWANVGFAMTIYLAGLQAIPMELYESGRIDGASGWQALRLITLPLLRASVTVNVLLCIIGSINMLDIIIVTTNGGPGFATYNLPFLVLTFIMNQGSTQGHATQGFAAAVSIVQFLFTLAVVLIVQKFLRGREVEI